MSELLESWISFSKRLLRINASRPIPSTVYWEERMNPEGEECWYWMVAGSRGDDQEEDIKKTPTSLKASIHITIRSVWLPVWAAWCLLFPPVLFKRSDVTFDHNHTGSSCCILVMETHGMWIRVNIQHSRSPTYLTSDLWQTQMTGSHFLKRWLQSSADKTVSWIKCVFV